jgi:hypothetical protein
MMINNQKQHIHSDLSQNFKPGEDCPGIVQTQHYITYLQSTRPNVAFPFICWATSSKTDFSLPYSLPETETCENKRIVEKKDKTNSQIWIKRSPLGQRKSDIIRQVTS